MQIESQLSDQIARYLDLAVSEANAKAVTTFDTVTQETINMIH